MQLNKSMVPDQNGVSLLYIMLEIHHSGWEPSKSYITTIKNESKCSWTNLISPLSRKFTTICKQYPLVDSYNNEISLLSALSTLSGLLCLRSLSDLCCVEETPTKLVYCDSVLSITEVAMQFLLLPGQKKSGVTTKTLTVKMTTTNIY